NWSCCELINGVCYFVFGNMKFPNLENKSKIKRESNENSPFPKGVFQFHLTYIVDGRKDSTFVTVEFESDPTVTISSLQNSLHNGDRPLTLKGNVITSRSNVQVEWFVIEGDLNLNDEEIVPFGPKRLELCITANKLKSKKYKFRLVATMEVAMQKLKLM